MTERKCEQCSAVFKAKAADIKRGWARFCSKSCKAKKQAFASRQSNRSDMPKWLRDDIQFDADMYDATSGWDEGGWLSDDSGVEKC